jgi:hypothetical protein
VTGTTVEAGIEMLEREVWRISSSPVIMVSLGTAPRYAGRAACGRV